MSSITRANVAFGVGTVFFTILGYLVFKKIWKNKIPVEWVEVGVLKELYLYPLKSGKGTKMKKVFCGKKGVHELDNEDNTLKLRDRSFLIYHNEHREVRTARQLPKSVLIETRSAENGIILSNPDLPDIFVGIPKVRNDIKVTFGNEPFTCTDCGDTIAKWLSQFLLGKDDGLRLGYGDGKVFRNITRDHKKWAEYYTNLDNDSSGIFSDLAALHLINQSSIEDLNGKLPSHEKITFHNFRPNFLIEGPAAFEEHQWHYIKIGEVVAKACLECMRCIESTVTPNGIMSKERQPLKLLEKYRNSESPFKGAVMGIYLKVIQTGIISEGDKVYVSKE